MAAAAEKPKAEATAAPASVPNVKGGSDKGAWIVVAIGAINLAAVIGMGVMSQKMWSRVKDLNAAVEHLAAEKPKDSKESSVGQDFKPKGMGVLYPLESFLVNIASDQGPKFLQAQMELELEDPAVEEEIAQKRPAIRDAVIVLLSSRSYRDLRDAGGVRALRSDLIRSVNGLLSSGKIKEIYFTQFHFN